MITGMSLRLHTTQVYHTMTYALRGVNHLIVWLALYFSPGCPTGSAHRSSIGNVRDGVGVYQEPLYRGEVVILRGAWHEWIYRVSVLRLVRASGVVHRPRLSLRLAPDRHSAIRNRRTVAGVRGTERLSLPASATLS